MKTYAEEIGEVWEKLRRSEEEARDCAEVGWALFGATWEQIISTTKISRLPVASLQSLDMGLPSLAAVVKDWEREGNQRRGSRPPKLATLFNLIHSTSTDLSQKLIQARLLYSLHSMVTKGHPMAAFVAKKSFLRERLNEAVQALEPGRENFGPAWMVVKGILQSGFSAKFTPPPFRLAQQGCLPRQYANYTGEEMGVALGLPAETTPESIWRLKAEERALLGKAFPPSQALNGLTHSQQVENSPLAQVNGMKELAEALDKLCAGMDVLAIGDSVRARLDAMKDLLGAVESENRLLAAAGLELGNLAPLHAYIHLPFILDKADSAFYQACAALVPPRPHIAYTKEELLSVLSQGQAGVVVPILNSPPLRRDVDVLLRRAKLALACPKGLPEILSPENIANLLLRHGVKVAYLEAELREVTAESDLANPLPRQIPQKTLSLLSENGRPPGALVLGLQEISRKMLELCVTCLPSPSAAKEAKEEDLLKTVEVRGGFDAAFLLRELVQEAKKEAEANVDLDKVKVKTEAEEPQTPAPADPEHLREVGKAKIPSSLVAPDEASGPSTEEGRNLLAALRRLPIDELRRVIAAAQIDI